MPERIDMSTFEAQFDDGTRYSKKMPNDDFIRLAFLNQRIDDIVDVNDMREGQFAALEAQQARINAELMELRLKIQRLLDERAPIDKTISQATQQNRADDRKRETYERERARLLQELAARERLLEQNEALLRSTENKPWRVGVDGKKALPHQIEGAQRLVSAERGLLGDKPGLGKTLQAIMTIDMLRAQGKGQKVLIFTPKSVLADFERAFKRWTDPTFVHVLNQTLKGIKSELLDAFAHFPELIVITNYEVWRRDRSIHEKLIGCGFDTVILDEAHVLKDRKSKTSQDVREIIYAENRCPNCGGSHFVQRGYTDKICAACEKVQEETGEFCSVKNVYPMTGTPILNKPQELFPLLNLIDREGFPKEENFLVDYCMKEYNYRTEKYFWSFGSGGSERLLKKLGMKYTARNRDSAGVTMPPQEIKHHWLELDPEKYPKQHRFVTELREKARLVFSDDHQMTQQETLAWYTRMRQAASWPDAIEIKGCAHDPICLDDYGDPGDCVNPTVIFPPPGAPKINESVMLDEAESIIREAVEDGDRIVVFSMFRKVLAELERRCETAGLRHAKIVGGVPDWRRQEYIDDFNTNQTAVGRHQYDVLLCQYQTAQVGLNLNGAQQLLMVEREWNPGKEEQTIDRLRRIDSEYESIVHMLHCAGTATDLIDAIQEQKKAVIEGFESEVDLMEAMRKFLEG